MTRQYEHMVQLSEFKKKGKTDLTDEDITKAFEYISAILREKIKALGKNGNSMVIHLRNGESFSYLVFDIDKITFE